MTRVLEISESSISEPDLAFASVGFDDDLPIQLQKPLVPGDLGTFGEYRILKLIGRGAAGAVFHAIDPVLGRDAALKILAPKSSSARRVRERFLREARACAKCRSEHVVSIYKTGECLGQPFIEMEYLKGKPLDRYLRRHKQLRFAQILRLGRDVFTGLSAVHELGIVHRDVKPGNIWLEAPSGKAKLLDFGLATADESAAEALTLLGTIVGTPAYMSPEQARGGNVTAQSDLFSMGVVLYQTACGQLPFNGNNALEVCTSIVADEPEPVEKRNPELPAAFANLVKRLLSKDVNRRPSSAQAVLDELKAFSPTNPQPPAYTPATLSNPIDDLLIPADIDEMMLTLDNVTTITKTAKRAKVIPEPEPEPVKPVFTLSPTAKLVALWAIMALLWLVACMLILKLFVFR